MTMDADWCLPLVDDESRPTTTFCSRSRNYNDHPSSSRSSSLPPLVFPPVPRHHPKPPSQPEHALERWPAFDSDADAERTKSICAWAASIPLHASPGPARSFAAIPVALPPSALHLSRSRAAPPALTRMTTTTTTTTTISADAQRRPSSGTVTVTKPARTPAIAISSAGCSSASVSTYPDVDALSLSPSAYTHLPTTETTVRHEPPNPSAPSVSDLIRTVLRNPSSATLRAVSSSSLSPETTTSSTSTTTPAAATEVLVTRTTTTTSVPAQQSITPTKTNMHGLALDDEDLLSTIPSATSAALYWNASDDEKKRIMDALHHSPPVGASAIKVPSSRWGDSKHNHHHHALNSQYGCGYGLGFWDANDEGTSSSVDEDEECLVGDEFGPADRKQRLRKSGKFMGLMMASRKEKEREREREREREHAEERRGRRRAVKGARS